MKSNEYECELCLLSKEVNSFIIKDMNLMICLCFLSTAIPVRKL